MTAKALGMMGGLLPAGICQAASRALTTGLVLRQPVGGRAAALGAYTALADGPAGFLHNPAGAGKGGGTSLGLDYTRQLAGHFGSAAASFSAGRAGFGVGVITLQGDSVEIRPSQPNSDPFTVRSEADYVGVLAAGRRFGRLLLGGSLKGFQLGLAQRFRARGVAGDAGLLLNRLPLGRSAALSLGAAAADVGADVKFLSAAVPLPFTAKAGAAIHFGEDPAGDRILWTLSGEYRREIRGRVNRFAAGLEMRLPASAIYPLQELSFRAGAETGDGPLRFQAGLGLRFGLYGMDYALRSAGPAGPLHQMTFSVLFGEKKRLYHPAPSAEGPPQPKYGRRVGTVEEILGLEEDGKFVVSSPDPLDPENRGSVEVVVVTPKGALLGRAFLTRTLEEVSGGFLYGAILAEPGSTVAEPGDSVHLAQ